MGFVAGGKGGWVFRWPMCAYNYKAYTLYTYVHGHSIAACFSSGK